MRKKIIISYDGTNYAGWQIQPNGLAVQQVLEEKLAMLYAWQKIRVEASGRTDAGVHALGQCAHFDEPERPNLPNDKILKALNRLLPSDIRITGIEDAPLGFHARFSAKGKTYVYVVNTGSEDAFTSRWSWHLENFTKLDEVGRCMEMLVGRHDFSSFTVERSEIDDAVRTITDARLLEIGAYKCLCFTGEGFLYKMVRSIVGTLSFVGAGKVSQQEFSRIFAARSRSEACDTAPPHGLFLARVYYGEEAPSSVDLESLPFLGILR